MKKETTQEKKNRIQKLRKQVNQEPKETTISFLHQFARAYRFEKELNPELGNIVLN